MLPSTALTGDIWYDGSNNLDINFREAFEKVILKVCSDEELDVGERPTMGLVALTRDRR